MTNPAGPSGLTPGQWGVTGTDGSIPSKATHTQENITQNLQNQFQSQQFSGLGGGLIAMILSFIGAGIASILGGFATIIDAIFGTVNDHYVSQLPTINDHTHSITTLQQQFDQVLLQGVAIVFTSNNYYTPTAGIKSIDVIIIGAGAGGAAGRWDLTAANRFAGGGGGGGGEVHTNIPASLLPVDGNGNFTPIPITIGAGGAGGVSDAAPGVGGGNTSFGSYLTAGGGVGGATAQNGDGLGNWINIGPGGAGGAGMIPGGAGGNSGSQSVSTPLATAGGNSTSAFDLHGGGGGGGGGGGNGAVGASGGIGGISPGGAAGSPGANGTAPSSVVATGGGGGGGGATPSDGGGDGAFPAGGGGGCGGGISSRGSRGGNGGNGILFVIEHSA